MEVRYKYNGDNSNFSFLLTADHHWDNPKCDRNKLKKHHDEAVARNAGIFCFGDLFCIMQGKGDPRGTKSDVRPEHNNGKYFDSIVRTAQEWYAPYADNYIMMSDGNHETSVAKRHETHLLERLCDRIGVQHMTYSGYIILIFEHTAGGAIRKYVINYHHGYGGGGPVTKNTIQANRRAVYTPDADLIVGGHVHERWQMEFIQERIKGTGETYLKSQWHLQLPTYKEEYMAHKGFHIEKGRPPKPTGATWLDIKIKGKEIEPQFRQAN